MSYFVHTNHINAWSLAKGLASLSLKLYVISDKPGLLPVSDRIPRPGDTLLFTDEAHLLSYYDQEAFTFFPRDVDKELIDDKLRVADRLRAMGEEPVPYWPLQHSTQGALPEVPIYLKARHSWAGRTKLPRGYICESERPVGECVEIIRDQDLPLDCFFFQRLITEGIAANYSTCGFFDHADPQKNPIIVTRKMLGNEPGRISTGAIVKTVRDPAKLRTRTCRILKKLQYTGPFELEFLHDSEEGRYYVLELNPRFWMQHGIFVEAYDNLVLKRYIGLQVGRWQDGELPFKPLVWLNGLHFFQLLIHGRLKRLKTYLAVLRQNTGHKTQVLWYPDRRSAVWYCVKEQLRKLPPATSTVVTLRAGENIDR